MLRALPKVLVAATAFCAVTALAAFEAQAQANKGGQGNQSGWSKGGKGGGGGSKGAPGPIAGAGLPILLLAGGYALVRRYRHHNADPLLTRASRA
jgi:hypothetical protein